MKTYFWECSSYLIIYQNTSTKLGNSKQSGADYIFFQVRLNGREEENPFIKGR